jgi:hypothetical protein
MKEDSDSNSPCAHIAAPTLFEMVNAKPMMGRDSRRAAVKPKTGVVLVVSGIEKGMGMEKGMVRKGRSVEEIWYGGRKRMGMGRGWKRNREVWWYVIRIRWRRR